MSVTLGVGLDVVLIAATPSRPRGVMARRGAAGSRRRFFKRLANRRGGDANAKYEREMLWPPSVTVAASCRTTILFLDLDAARRRRPLALGCPSRRRRASRPRRLRCATCCGSPSTSTGSMASRRVVFAGTQTRRIIFDRTHGLANVLDGFVGAAANRVSPEQNRLSVRDVVHCTCRGVVPPSCTRVSEKPRGRVGNHAVLPRLDDALVPAARSFFAAQSRRALLLRGYRGEVLPRRRFVSRLFAD